MVSTLLRKNGKAFCEMVVYYDVSSHVDGVYPRWFPSFSIGM